ncbi:MAG: TadE/TadG family type IV pilus assembly protein [Chloroflexota bacterium]
MPRLRRRTEPAAAPAGPVARARQRGQSLVEFAIVLTPLMLLMMGIVQLGLVFNAYVTISSAAREAARAASVYVYDRTLTKAQNDAARLTTAKNTLSQSLGLLSKTSPNYVAAEQTIAYSLPTGVTDSEPRTGQYAKVHVRYHLDILVPLVADLLPLSNGRLTLDAETTMVVN